MVSSTLCPAVHILGSQNVYGRAEGIADHYWPWAVFFIFFYYPLDLRLFRRNLLLALFEALLTQTEAHSAQSETLFEDHQT